jgi:hypothetical protein
MLKESQDKLFQEEINIHGNANRCAPKEDSNVLSALVNTLKLRTGNEMGGSLDLEIGTAGVQSVRLTSLCIRQQSPTFLELLTEMSLFTKLIT